MATLTAVCNVADVPPGSMKGFKCGDKEVLVAQVEGQFYAVEGVCPHMSGYLAKGRLVGANVVCPVHGAEYDVRSGKLMKSVPWIMKRMSKTLPRDLESYPVEVEDGTVSIRLNDT